MTTTPNTPDVWAFLKEAIQRFGKKQPKFFVVISWISAIAAFLTGIPGILEEINSLLPEADKFTMPGFVLILQSKVVAWMGVWGWFIAKLAVQRDAPLPDAAALPFTAKKESDPKVNTSPSKGL